MWTLVGIFLAWITLPNGWENAVPVTKTGLLCNDFARKWDGGCHGWTHHLTAVYMIGHICTFWSYVTISFIIMELHPVVGRTLRSRVTIDLMFGFIISCGVGHLLEAYASINPIYYLVSLWHTLNWIIGYVAAIFIAIGLLIAFADFDQQRAEQQTQESDG